MTLLTRKSHNIIKHSFYENIKEFDYLLISHWNWNVLHFPHSAFSKLRIFHTPHFPHSALSTLCTFHTSHFPHSSFSTEPILSVQTGNDNQSIRNDFRFLLVQAARISSRHLSSWPTPGGKSNLQMFCLCAALLFQFVLDGKILQQKYTLKLWYRQSFHLKGGADYPERFLAECKVQRSKILLTTQDSDTATGKARRVINIALRKFTESKYPVHAGKLNVFTGILAKYCFNF